MKKKNESKYASYAPIYRAAAERIFKGKNGYCCTALAMVLFQRSVFASRETYIDLLSEYFRPRNIKKNDPWFGECYENSEWRIMSLLLMAEIVENP